MGICPLRVVEEFCGCAVDRRRKEKSFGETVREILDRLSLFWYKGYGRCPTDARGLSARDAGQRWERFAFMKTYPLRVAGLDRALPFFPVGGGTFIAGFLMMGDVELTICCARALLKKCPLYDVLITPETKSIPLCMEMARQNGDASYVVARKQEKLYMRDVICAEVKSITTAAPQRLYLDGGDARLLKNRRVLIVDDVISTGHSLAAVEKLVVMAGGKVAGRAAVLAEGDAAEREDIVFLERLPLFTAEEVSQ